MTLNIDLEDVPDAILEAVKARIMANRRRLEEENQQQEDRSLKQAATIRRQAPDELSWKRPQSAAVPSGSGWLLVPSGPPDGLSLRCITSFPNKLLSAATGSESLGRLLNGGLAPVISLGSGQEYTSAAEGYADLSSSASLESYNIDESQIIGSDGSTFFTFPVPAAAVSQPAAGLRSYTFECFIQLGVNANAPRPSVQQPSTESQIPGFWTIQVPSPPSQSLDGLTYTPFSPFTAGFAYQPGTSFTIACNAGMTQGELGEDRGINCSGYTGRVRFHYYGPNGLGIVGFYPFGSSSPTGSNVPGGPWTYTPSRIVEVPGGYYSWEAAGEVKIAVALIANGEVVQGAAFNASVGIDFVDGTFSEYISCDAGVISGSDSLSPLSVDESLLQKNQKSHLAAVKTSEAFDFYFNGQNIGSIPVTEELDPALSYQIAVAVSSQVSQSGSDSTFNGKYNTMPPYVMPVSGIRFTPGRALYRGPSFTPPTSITRLA